MQVPVQISLHGIRRSQALYEAIRRRVRKLDRFHERITSCRVVLALAGRRQRHGRQLTVRIDLKVPGRELAVTREHDPDLRIALREAFGAARRRLQDCARQQRGELKRRAP